MFFRELSALLDPEPRPGALNMAIDEALLRAADRPLLRVYRWAQPAVSFGYFGSHGEVAARWPERELVRRWTGGGEVPHGEDFTFTLMVPRSDPFCRLSAAESYAAIHQQVADLLGDASIAASAAPKISEACFENPAASDVLRGPQKIAGGAQRRTRAGLLHQGSIQLPNLGADFALQLTQRLAITVQVEPLSTRVCSAAEQLVGEKYGTDKWLRRFE